MMRLPKFKYYAPKSLSEALKIFSSEREEAMVVAGGTDLLPNMKRRQQTPATLVSLKNIKEFHLSRSNKRHVKGDEKTGFQISPMATLSEICGNAKINKLYPSLAKALSLIATPIIRNMGTIGGNVCLDTRCQYYDQDQGWRESIGYCMKTSGNGNPAPCRVAPGSPRCVAVNSSDSAPVLCSLGVQFKLISQRGERVVNASDFYHEDGVHYVSKQYDEILSEIMLPPALNVKATYLKLRRRGSFDFPGLGVAVAIQSSNGEVEEARIFLNSISSAPIEALDAEKILIGTNLEEEVISQCAELARKIARPFDNTDFLPHWRKEMTGVFVRRALLELKQPR